MLLYIIDGFNLLHRVPELRKTSAPHNDLINYVRRCRLTGSSNNKVIIVFDGWPPSSFLIDKKYRIMFSNEQEADDIVIQLAKKSKPQSETIVVSDDRKIRDAVSRTKAKPLRTYEFIKIKNKAVENNKKEISYSLQKEITDEMRKIWLDKETL